VARDDAVPLARLWARVDQRWGVPVWALVLLTGIQMLLGLINLANGTASSRATAQVARDAATVILIEQKTVMTRTYILARVMGSPAGGLGLVSLVLVITVFCSISITVVEGVGLRRSG
jgi:amino acid transporter